MNSDKNHKNGLSLKGAHLSSVTQDRSLHQTPLRTKICVPPSADNWIARRRLDPKLEQGFKRKLTLVSAPAGFGKTTLLSDWINRCQVPVVWVSADKRDNDVLNMLSSVIFGLRQMADGIDGIGNAALSMLQAPQPPHMDIVLTSLLNDIARIPQDFSLVVDDYHLVEAKPIHDLMGFLIDHLAENMHMVISTRIDPPLPLARVRSQNNLTELRAKELSFDLPETTDFLNQRLDKNLSSDDIKLIQARTEGWIAGLQLASLSLQERENPSEFIQGFKGDNRYIADYLTEEILNRQPENLRQFLLSTSILGRFCASLCDAVTNQTNSHQLLEKLEKNNLFVIPLDDERRWYRYHHLFTDLLRKRLVSQKKDRVPDLHQRASQWFADKGLRYDAMDHAFGARDYNAAGRLIEDIAEGEWDRSQESIIMQWIAKLPASLVQANPNLCIFYARELFKAGHVKDAESKLQTAEQLLASASISAAQENELRGRIAVVRAYISARTGDTRNIIRNAKQALELLPPTSLMWRSVAATNLGFGYGWAGSGDCVKAQQAFAEAKRISSSAGNTYYQVFAGSCLGSIMMIRCKFRNANNVCEQSLDLAIKNGLEQAGIVGSLYANLGTINCERNELNLGLELLNKSVAISRLGRDPVILASCGISLLRGQSYRLDFAGALKTIEMLKECERDFALPPWITNTITAIQVHLWLAGGNLNAALEWAKERNLSHDDKVDNLHEIEHLTLAHVLMAQNKRDEADGLLKRTIANAKSGDRVYMMIEMLIYRALIQHAKQNHAAALNTLNTALLLAEPSGLIMIFASKGKPVGDLLEAVLASEKQAHDVSKAGFSLSYVKKILRAFKTNLPIQKDELPDPISERELEVLRLMATGLSNREIGDKLFISLNTVKTHTKHINQKLEVGSRIKAVIRAKALNLL